MTKRSRRGALGVFVLFSLLAVPAGAAVGPQGELERVSVSSQGLEADDNSGYPMMDGSGRFVVFSSSATTLVPGDSNGQPDVFIHDRSTATTTRVSTSASGGEGNGHSCNGSISGNGRYVVFCSAANNLVPGDTNFRMDVFRKDLLTGELELASVAADGSSANNSSILGSQAQAISDDGRYIVYASVATNVVPGTPGINNGNHIYLRDMVEGTNHLMSQSSDEVPGEINSQTPAISGDGRVVVYETRNPFDPVDTNALMDIYARDWQAGETHLVSVDDAGRANNGGAWRPRPNYDGSVVSYDSTSTDLVPRDQGGITPDVYVRDLAAGRTEKVSATDTGAPADDWAFRTSISSDGRFVAYWSSAMNHAPEKRDLTGDAYVRDRVLGLTELVSLGAGGFGNSTSQLPGISGDGGAVSFMSFADNLVTGDTNGANDVFARDLGDPIGFLDGITLDASGDSVEVSGTPRATGAVLANAADPVGDLLVDQAGAAAGDIRGLDVVYRHHTANELLFKVSYEDLPHPVFGVAAPGVVYGVSFTLPSGRYEIRMNSAEDAAIYPIFDLYRCAPVCIPIGATQGGYGTIGDQIHFTAALDAVGAQPGDPITDVRAFAALGSSQTGGVPVDEATAPEAVLPVIEVALAIAPAGSEPTEADYRPVETGEQLSESLDVASLEPGPYEVWARTCLGTQCGYATAAFAIEGDDPVEPAPTFLSLALEQVRGDVVATAQLLDETGSPLTGDTIEFQLRGVTNGSAVTDEQGLAVWKWHRNELKHGDEVVAVFIGDTELAASRATAVFAGSKTP